MLNTEIPKQYTTSPSSFSGTPHLTINREITVDLDSTHAFEGNIKNPITVRCSLTITQAPRNY